MQRAKHDRRPAQDSPPSFVLREHFPASNSEPPLRVFKSAAGKQRGFVCAVIHGGHTAGRLRPVIAAPRGAISHSGHRCRRRRRRARNRLRALADPGAACADGNARTRPVPASRSDLAMAGSMMSDAVSMPALSASRITRSCDDLRQTRKARHCGRRALAGTHR
jgi:hypothetical protein